jgi:hypothetical protein
MFTVEIQAQPLPIREDGCVAGRLRNKLAIGMALAVCAALVPAHVEAATVAGPALSIDVTKTRHAISPDIYGMNGASDALEKELHLTVDRWGGNTTSRYNWQNNTDNTGADWYFENIVRSPSDSVDSFINANAAHNTGSVITVPLIGYVAKNSPADHPFACGFPKTRFASQQSFDQWDPNCGNGLKPNGAPITGAVPTDTSIAVGTPFVSNYVSHLVATHGSAAVRAYELDNEPTLWSSTHRDVHPNPPTYDELAMRATTYAAAIKAADPKAQTLGPSDWGWCAYFYSAADPGGCGPGPDRTAHGDTPLAQWWLAQMKAYADAHGGKRLLDYFDEHYYPQEAGVALSPAGSAATQALRLRSTRSLWDPTYVDESWIGTDVGAPPIRLIRQMRTWVQAAYPGTKLAITEYNFGGLESMNGALAQADVLGIFGREGLSLATLWAPPTSSQPGAFAFRMYRNYDGLGRGFGDTGVLASSANQGKLAVYAAQRTADGALTVMVVNKTAQALTSTLTINGTTGLTTAGRYQYSGANLSAIVHEPSVAVSNGAVSATYPANSITLFVVK